MARKKQIITETGTPELRNHYEVEMIETIEAGVKVARVMTQIPLDVYYRRGLLGNGVSSQKRYDAGNKLHRLFMASGLPKVRAMSLCVVRVDGGKQDYIQSENQMDAWQKLINAINSVDKISRKVIVAVCCLEENAGKVLKNKKINERAAQCISIYLLKEGLDQLVKYWRL
jgi:hypothetical protein